MNYILTYDNQVFLGPMAWRPRMFQSVILDDYERTVVIPPTDPLAPYQVDVNILIRPAIINTPTFNSKIQGLNGPFYTMTASNVTLDYTVVDLNIDLVKSQLKDIVSANRYTKEISGITLSLYGTNIYVTTARIDRDIYLQSYQLGTTNQTFKFPGGTLGQGKTSVQYPTQWLTLTNADLQTITQAIAAHVSGAFAWESSKATEINNCTTLAQLDAVVLV